MNVQSDKQFQTHHTKLPSKGGVSILDRKVTNSLPKGAQGQLIDAALIAENLGLNINKLTTIRTRDLLQRPLGFMGKKHEADGVACLLELMRHWHKKRGIDWTAIWSREYGSKIGSHLHMGTHLPKELNDEYITALSHWTNEARVYPRLHQPDEIGHSEDKNWLVQCCQRQGRSGLDVAAYLGKDEPSVFDGAWYGIKRPNNAKRVFKRRCKGGVIEGTHRFAYRFGTSRNISPSSSRNEVVLKSFSDAQRLIIKSDFIPY